MSVVLTQELKSKILSIFMPAGKLHRLYLFEGIPPRKLGNAISRYASVLGKDESIILLYDDTVFGTGKDGFLLTTKRLYGRNIADSSSFVEVKDISTITLGRSGFVAAMQVHSVAGPVLSKHLSMSAQQNQEATLVFGLNQTIALLKPESTATGAAVQVENSAPTKTICTGCGATLQVGTVCKFCRRLAQQ